MADMAERATVGTDRTLRLLFWAAAAALLLAPAAAMRFTGEVSWTASDFLFAGLMLGTVGVAFEVTMRMTRSWTYRFAMGFAVLAAFLIVLANGAVGMIGEEDNPYNLYFLAVIGLALVGAIASRLRAAPMSLVMLAAGAVHAALALGGMSVDVRGAAFSAVFAGFWLISALLFRLAAREQS